MGGTFSHKASITDEERSYYFPSFQTEACFKRDKLSTFEDYYNFGEWLTKPTLKIISHCSTSALLLSIGIVKVENEAGVEKLAIQTISFHNPAIALVLALLRNRIFLALTVNSWYIVLQRDYNLLIILLETSYKSPMLQQKKEIVQMIESNHSSKSLYPMEFKQLLTSNKLLLGKFLHCTARRDEFLYGDGFFSFLLDQNLIHLVENLIPHLTKHEWPKIYTANQTRIFRKFVAKSKVNYLD